MKICTNCDEPIGPDEPFDTIDHPGTSGAGVTLYRHQWECKKVPTQTAPVGLGG